MERKLVFFKIYGILMSILVTILLALNFINAGSSNDVLGKKVKFSEIDVEKINIVGADGKKQLAIANAQNRADTVMDGKVYPRIDQKDGLSAGMIFFNSEGDECGGLVFGNKKDKDGNNISSGSLTFDQYKQQEALKLSYSENKNSRQAGLQIFDEPETSIAEDMDKQSTVEKMPDGPEKDTALKKLNEEMLTKKYYINRVFIGKEQDKTTGMSISELLLNDVNGKVRIKIMVDVDGQPILQFLDEAGKVTYSLPPKD